MARSPGGGHPSSDRPGALTDLVARYGWRVYAVPVLALVTIVALFQPGRAHPSAQAPSTSSSIAPPVSAPARPAAVVPPTQVWSEAEPTACAHNTKSSYVVVDIAAQHAWMCEGARQVNSTAVTTGATDLDDATPTGSWLVQAKQPNRYLSGKDYNRFVHFWIPFDGDIGFHGAGWQTMPFGASGYPKLGSHGCVHMPTPMMAWLYHWIQPGRTTVTVVA